MLLLLLCVFVKSKICLNIFQIYSTSEHTPDVLLAVVRLLGQQAQNDKMCPYITVDNYAFTRSRIFPLNYQPEDFLKGTEARDCRPLVFFNNRPNMGP